MQVKNSRWFREEMSEFFEMNSEIGGKGVWRVPDKFLSELLRWNLKSG